MFNLKTVALLSLAANVLLLTLTPVCGVLGLELRG